MLSQADLKRWHKLARELAPRLAARFEAAWRQGQAWVTPRLTYDDARLAEAVLRSSSLVSGREAASLRAVGFRALEQLWATLWSEEHGCIVLPGNRHLVTGDSAAGAGLAPDHYDQQPLDAAALQDACLAAYGLSGQVKWLKRARLALAWFHGRNLTGAVLGQQQLGACSDGLTPTGPNLNQGAESTLSYLMALLTLAPKPGRLGRYAPTRLKLPCRQVVASTGP